MVHSSSSHPIALMSQHRRCWKVKCLPVRVHNQPATSQEEKWQPQSGFSAFENSFSSLRRTIRLFPSSILWLLTVWGRYRCEAGLRRTPVDRILTFPKVFGGVIEMQWLWLDYFWSFSEIRHVLMYLYIQGIRSITMIKPSNISASMSVY